MWRPALRKLAVGGLGATGGYALNEWRNQVEACSLTCALGSVLCAAGTLGMLVKVSLAGQQWMQEEGLRMLLERAQIGDASAALCVAGMEYLQGGMDAALPLIEIGVDDSLDCKALKALSLLRTDRAKAEKMLLEARDELLEEMKWVRSQAPGQFVPSIRPPQPPGVLPQPPLDESQQEMCQMAGVPYASLMLQAMTARTLDLPKSSLSREAEDALLYICAVRGFSPFFYELARRAENDGRLQDAATNYFECLVSVNANSNRHIAMCLAQPARPNATDESRNQQIATFLAAIIGSQISLCKLVEQGVSPPFAQIDEGDNKTLLMRAVSGCSELHNAMTHLFPKSDVIDTFVDSFEHCKKAYNTDEKNSRDLQLCSEYFNVLVDHLDMQAKASAKQA